VPGVYVRILKLNPKKIGDLDKQKDKPRTKIILKICLDKITSSFAPKT
jgi:hypothetical protein